MTLMWKAAAAFIVAIGAGGFVAGAVLGDSGDPPDVGDPVVLTNEPDQSNRPADATPGRNGPKDDDDGDDGDGDDGPDTVYHEPEDVDDDSGQGRGRGRGRGGDDRTGQSSGHNDDDGGDDDGDDDGGDND